MPELNLLLSQETLNELLSQLDNLSSHAALEIAKACMDPAVEPEQSRILREQWLDVNSVQKSTDWKYVEQLEHSCQSLKKLGNVAFDLDFLDLKCPYLMQTSAPEAIKEHSYGYFLKTFQKWWQYSKDMLEMRNFLRGCEPGMFDEMCTTALQFPGCHDFLELMDRVMFVFWRSDRYSDVVEYYKQINWTSLHEHFGKWQQNIAESLTASQNDKRNYAYPETTEEDE